MSDSLVVTKRVAATALKFLAPYLAVAVGWCWLSNGWIAVIAYHVQVLAWARFRIPAPGRPARRRYLFPALAGGVAGPVLYLLLPSISDGRLPAWFSDHGLSATAMLLLLPYFGLVHPWIEQVHWAPLREHGLIAHPLFAGYHVLVLVSLTTWPWLLLVFAVLSVVSYLWAVLTARSGSLLPAYVSHALADIGIVVAAWLRV